MIAERPSLYITVLGSLLLKMLRYQQRFKLFETGRLCKDIHLVNLSDEIADGDLDRVFDATSAHMKAGPTTPGRSQTSV